MKYVALLRGINVGGARKVPMVKLTRTFEQLGFGDVRTYIASGNVIFSSDSKDETRLTRQIEEAIDKDFGFAVSVLLRSENEIGKLVKAIPKNWVNDKNMKCDVMFLWKEFDNKKVLQSMPHNPEIEDLIYAPGAVIWRIDRDNINKGQMVKIIGSQLYKKLTIRNPNTVRQIYELMKSP